MEFKLVLHPNRLMHLATAMQLSCNASAVSYWGQNLSESCTPLADQMSTSIRVGRVIFALSLYEICMTETCYKSNTTSPFGFLWWYETEL